MCSLSEGAMEKGVFVLGASGMVGREVVKELLFRPEFGKVVLITRRKLEEDLYNGVEQRIVNFDKIEEYGEAFQGLETGFCCLGTTRAKVGADEFVKVDHGYVVNSAKVAKANGCKHFSVVSASESSASSFFLYPKTKGRMENHLKELGFDRLSIFRPAFLLHEKRDEARLGETIGSIIVTPLSWLFPTRCSIQTSSLARVMVNNVRTPCAEKVETFSNPDIHRLAHD